MSFRSATLIKSNSPGVKVYLDGQFKEESPCFYGDTAVAGITRTVTSLPFSLPFDELLDHDSGLAIGKLDERMFHRIGGDGNERTTDLPFTCNLAASDGIDGHPPTVG